MAFSSYGAKSNPARPDWLHRRRWGLRTKLHRGRNRDPTERFARPIDANRRSMVTEVSEFSVLPAAAPLHTRCRSHWRNYYGAGSAQAAFRRRRATFRLPLAGVDI